MHFGFVWPVPEKSLDRMEKQKGADLIRPLVSVR
jgi:hypothetical protein